MMGLIGKMFLFRCKVCTFVQKEKNCLSPNLMACKTKLGDTRPLLQGSSVTRSLFLLFHEITIMDCQSWFLVHVYIVDGWKCILNSTNLGTSGE